MFVRERVDGVVDPQDAATVLLGKGSKLTGKLVLDGSGRLEGRVEGEVTSRGTLIIGEGAVVNAQVNGTSIVVQGRVTGDITASTRLELRGGSEVTGNVSTPSLVIQEGAIFQGQCAMNGAEAARGEKGKVVALPKEKEEPATPPAAHSAGAR
jgi:cytoskeletal protein CcmA (bactofilin family)